MLTGSHASRYIASRFRQARSLRRTPPSNACLELTAMLVGRSHILSFLTVSHEVGVRPSGSYLSLRSS